MTVGPLHPGSIIDLVQPWDESSAAPHPIRWHYVAGPAAMDCDVRMTSVVGQYIWYHHLLSPVEEANYGAAGYSSGDLHGIVIAWKH